MKERRITLLDGMTLIAATAIGLSLARYSWPTAAANPSATWSLTWPITPSAGYPSRTWLIPFADRGAPFLPCLAAWSGSIIVFRCIQPRPRWRRLVRQPGFVAAVIVVATLTIETALLVGSARSDGRFGQSSPSSVATFAANGVVLLAHHAGLAVAASWLTLALIGRWRPEASWIDRFGRVLGFAWIVIGPLASLLMDQTPWWGNFLGP